MPLKTLHLTNSWHETSGGIATFYRALLAEANRRGHFIRLVVPAESDRIESVGSFAKIHHLKAPRARFNREYRTIYPSQYLRASSPIQQILADESPDLVEICDKYTLHYLGGLLRHRLLAAVDARPIVVGLSCERMDDNFEAYVGRVPAFRFFCAAYMKWIYFPAFDQHIANSRYTAEELHAASRGQLVDRNIWIAPMGADLEHFSPERRSGEARRRLVQNAGGSEESVLLLYAGRLAPEKNLSLLFEVFSRLAADERRDYRLLVAGDGIERAKWESLSKKHAAGRALFLGHIKKARDLAELFANADVFVHPNPREPFGIAPLEAMASGLPLVAPDRGGVRSYANEENAWLASPDTASFQAAIEELLAEDAERDRRIKNALATAAVYRWDRVAASFLDLYAQLAGAGFDQSAPLPRPAFSSTPPRGVGLAFSRGITRSAERAVQLALTFFSR